MNRTAPRSIAIVGGGASATLLLAQLSLQLNNHFSQAIDIYIIDDSNAYKIGIAYHIQHPSFLLNVAANQMGAFQDKPDDFYLWLLNHPELWRKLDPDFKSIEFKSSDFVPRMIYAAYLNWLFDKSIDTAIHKNICVQRVKARAKKIYGNTSTQKLHITTDTNETIIVDSLVFATGNQAQNLNELTSPHIFSSPYCNEFLAHDWPSTQSIIIVGSGLSMIDAVQYLNSQNYSGKIEIFSRHALIPLPHSTSSSTVNVPSFFANELTSARTIVRRLREQISINLTQGISWQATINEFRTQVNSIWLSLSKSEQKRLKKCLPWWNIVRHRIPAAGHELFMKLHKEGKISIIKSKITKAESDGEYFLLQGNKKSFFVKSEKLIVCSGYKCGYEYLIDLCGDLLEPADKIGHRFSTENQAHKLAINHSIYAIGPSLTGLLFETTSINEIRTQSKRIAERLAQEFVQEPK